MRKVALLPIALVALAAGILSFVASAPTSAHVASVTVGAPSQRDIEAVAASLEEPALAAQVASMAARAEAAVTDDLAVAVTDRTATITVTTTDAELSTELAALFAAVAEATQAVDVSVTSTSVRRVVEGGSRWIPTVVVAVSAAGAVAAASELLRRRRAALIQARRAGLSSIGSPTGGKPAPTLVQPRHIGVRRRPQDRPGHHHDPRFRLVDNTTSPPAR